MTAPNYVNIFMKRSPARDLKVLPFICQKTFLCRQRQNGLTVEKLMPLKRLQLGQKWTSLDVREGTVKEERDFS